MFVSIKDLETVSFDNILDGLSAQNNECMGDIQEPNKKKIPNKSKDSLTNENVNECDVLGVNNLNFVAVNVQNEQHDPLMPDKLFLNDEQNDNLVCSEENIEYVDNKQPNKKFNNIEKKQISSEDNEFKDNEANGNMNRNEKCNNKTNVIQCNEIVVSVIKNGKLDIEKENPLIMKKVSAIEKNDFKTNNDKSDFESKNQEVDKESNNYLYLGAGSIIVCSIVLILLCIKLKNTN